MGLTTFDNQVQKEAFKRFCLSGKGFVRIHSAISSERYWPWFWKLISRVLFKAFPFQTFTILVKCHDHASNKHLSAKFESEDECYFIKNINPNFKVSLEVDLSTVFESKESENNFCPHKVPLYWTNNFEGGRQWYNALRHSKKVYSQAWFKNRLQVGIQNILQDKYNLQLGIRQGF